MSSTDNSLRDPDIVRYIQAQAEIIAEAQAVADDRGAEIAALLEAGGMHNIRKAERLKGEISAQKSKIKLAEDNIRRARDIEAERDRRMGEARDPLIWRKIRGEQVSVQLVEKAEIARDKHGAKIINRAGPNRGLAALLYDLGANVNVLSGIRHAYVKGHLHHPKTKRGGEAKLEIGALYEAKIAAANPLKAVNPEASGGGGFGPRGPQQAAVEASEWLALARYGRKGKTPLTPKQRHMLDAVCGEGCNVWQAAQAMKPAMSVPAAARALRGGLAQVSANIAEAREAKAFVTGAKIKAGRNMEEEVRIAG